MNRPVSVLWKPNGASDFRSRHAWGNRVAYQSQFNEATNRAHAGKERIKARLIADLDPDEWDLPPKPKSMRWKTYNRHEQRYDRYEEVLDRGLAALVANLGKNFLSINEGIQVSQEISIRVSLQLSAHFVKA
jgi:hypothetical protein